MTSTSKPLEEPYVSRAVPPATARYWSWLFAAPEFREPLLGVYALTAEWRALTDPATDVSAAQLKLAWWREEIGRLATGTEVHPISRYLASLPAARGADFGPLAGTIEAAARQIAGAPIERGAELEAHGAALFANPLLVAARLARHAPLESGSGSAASRSMSSLATAQYLASAVADYRRDARHGRVIFPVDELLAAGIEDADLCAADPSPRLRSYLDGLRRRAAQSFDDAARCLPPAERAAMRHLLVLAQLGARRLYSGKPDGGFRLNDLYSAWTTARRAARQT